MLSKTFLVKPIESKIIPHLYSNKLLLQEKFQENIHCISEFFSLLRGEGQNHFFTENFEEFCLSFIKHSKALFLCCQTASEILSGKVIRTSILTLSRRRPLSYRNQSINLQSKSMDWFLYDNGLCLERVKSTIYH